jgi:secretory phospholipase A2
VSNDLKNCCIEHDICYQTCNSKRIECDENLKLCIQLYCETVESAEQVHICVTFQSHINSHNNNLLLQSNKSMGCEKFVNSQLEACSCVDTRWKISNLIE